MVKTYTVCAEPDPDGGWIGEVDELPGCYSDGGDLERLEHNMREAIQVYLETIGSTGIGDRIEMTVRQTA